MQLFGISSTQVTKILATSTLAGTAVWLGKTVIPLNFQCGFLFSALSLISIKIAHKIDSLIEKRFRIPIIPESIFCVIAFGIPTAFMHQITPLNLLWASYLTIIAAVTRQIYFTVTGKSPFL